VKRILPHGFPSGGSPFGHAPDAGWAGLPTRVYEGFRLQCTQCGAPPRIIVFVTEPGSVQRILEQCEEPTAPPLIASVRGLPPEFTRQP